MRSSESVSDMTKTETVRARVKPELKRGAEAVLEKIGLTSSEAITLCLTQVKLTKGLPFPLRVPNTETKRAIKDARAQGCRDLRLRVGISEKGTRALTSFHAAHHATDAVPKRPQARPATAGAPTIHDPAFRS
jgi:addiction module RelB/DinJ family antitoxin